MSIYDSPTTYTTAANATTASAPQSIDELCKRVEELKKLMPPMPSIHDYYLRASLMSEVPVELRGKVRPLPDAFVPEGTAGYRVQKPQHFEFRWRELGFVPKLQSKLELKRMAERHLREILRTLLRSRLGITPEMGRRAARRQRGRHRKQRDQRLHRWLKDLRNQTRRPWTMNYYVPTPLPV
jgi:hypothetical protein